VSARRVDRKGYGAYSLLKPVVLPAIEPCEGEMLSICGCCANGLAHIIALAELPSRA
jgi:hypothetical protein